MALDADLLDKFERDWGEALENYEARSTAARLANTDVPPWARTFVPPAQDRGIQREIFAPIQAKWSMLQEGAGRGSSASPFAEPKPITENTRAGVFERDFDTGEWRQVVNVPSTNVPRMGDRERIIFSSAARRLENARKFAAEARGSQRVAAEAELRAAESDFEALNRSMPSAPEQQVDESMFAQRPDQMMRPNPRGFSFMGDPFDAPAGTFPPEERPSLTPQAAPIAVGPSVSRGIKILRRYKTGE